MLIWQCCMIMQFKLTNVGYNVPSNVRSILKLGSWGISPRLQYLSYSVVTVQECKLTSKDRVFDSLLPRLLVTSIIIRANDGSLSKSISGPLCEGLLESNSAPEALQDHSSFLRLGVNGDNIEQGVLGVQGTLSRNCWGFRLTCKVRGRGFLTCWQSFERTRPRELKNCSDIGQALALQQSTGKHFLVTVDS